MRTVDVVEAPPAKTATRLLRVGVPRPSARPTHASSEGNDHLLRSGSVSLRATAAAARRRLPNGGDHDSGGPTAEAARQLRLGGPAVRCGGVWRADAINRYVLDPGIFLPANEFGFPSLLETSKKQGFDVTLTLDF